VHYEEKGLQVAHFMTTSLSSTSGYRFIKGLNLRFEDKALEREFVDYYVQSALRVSQTLMFIGAFAYYLSFISDQVMDPKTGYENHILRGTIAVPVMFLCAISLFFYRMHKYYEIIAIIYFLIPYAISCLIYINIKEGYEHAALGFVLLLMGSNLTFTVRLKYTLIISIFGFLSMIIGHIYADNAMDGWIKINVNYMLTAIIFSSVSAHFRERAARKRFLTERAIVESQQLNDDLLYSMLPQHIAQRMQAGETSIADSLGEVSIIFANVTGLRDPDSSVKPLDRVRGLNRLFSIFDAEAERYGVEKIKTIGGSYMAIGGLSTKNMSSDHAENIANFALAIQAIVKKWNRSLGISIDFRVGIHVGPIVAGVIGLQRPRFDCWGDSVNIASRLENSATTGDIYISETSYWRLKQKFDIEPVGYIELKGVGKTQAYKLGQRFDEKTFVTFLDQYSPTAEIAR
jgi:class 3 adenylate cyclase